MPALGYVIGNVAFISNGVNQLKGNLTLDEIERLLTYIKGTSDAEHTFA